MWDEVYKKIVAATSDMKTYEYIFRGHCNNTWKLLPSIARNKLAKDMEESIYFDYLTMSGTLIKEFASPWAVVVSMQHHGIPTRLLDWTDKFSVALYFALKDAKEETPCVWIVDPYKLNYQSIGRPEVLMFDELEGNYIDIFLKKNKELGGKALAVAPNRHLPRAYHQGSLFTVHDNLDLPVDELAPEAAVRVDIPKEAHEDAWKFLALAGISEYSLFPDLDGLARHIKQKHCSNAHG